MSDIQLMVTREKMDAVALTYGSDVCSKLDMLADALARMENAEVAANLVRRIEQRVHTLKLITGGQ